MLRDDRIIDLAKIYCDLDTDSRGRTSFEFDNHGVVAFARAVERAAYRAQCETLISERNEAREERDALAKDAAIGRAVWRFIDRMTDVCDTDPAERIVREFVNAVYPAIEAALPRRPNHAPE